MSSSDCKKRRAQLQALAAQTKRSSQSGSIRALSTFSPLHELERSWRLAAARQRIDSIVSTTTLFLSGEFLRSPAESFRASPLTSIATGLVLSAGLLSAAHVWANPMTEAASNAVIRVLLPADGLMREFGETKRCAMRRRMVDRAGLTVWARESDRCGQEHFRTTSLENDDLRRFAQVLEIFEGKISGPETLSGLNLLGVARALWALPARLIGSGPRIGGSNPLQSAIKNLMKRAGRAGTFEKLAFIVRNVQVGAELPARVDRIRFVVESLPLVRGGDDSSFGPIVSGALVPWVVFDKPDYQSLTDAERCILGAAAKRQIEVPAKRSSIQALIEIQAANESIRSRALMRCPQGMVAAGLVKPTKVAQLRDDIAQLKFPVVVRTIANPDVQFRKALSGARHLVTDSLKLGVGPSEVGLSVSTDRQSELVLQVSALEGTLAPRLNAQLCLAQCQAGQTRADVLSVVIESHSNGQDRIVAAYQSTPGLWHGPTQIDQTRRIRAVPHRSLGSLPKILLAPMWVEAGVERLCLKSFANVHDAGNAGFDCTHNSHFLSVASALARSSNLATAEAIRLVGTESVRAYLARLGLSIDTRPTVAALRRSMALGENAVASPEIFTRAFTAMLRGVDGHRATGQAASIFNGGNTSAESVNFAETIVSTRALGQSAELLKAPLVHAKGTLRHMAEPLIKLGCKPSSFAGKSGSSDASGPSGNSEVRDRLVVVSAQCGGASRYVVFSMIGSPRVDVPLGDISTIDVGKLALASLKTALKTAPSH